MNINIGDEFLKELFNDSYRMLSVRDRAEMILNNHKSVIDMNSLSRFNYNLISIYIEWMRTFDEHKLSDNIKSFIIEFTKVINSDMFNLQIIHEVYNPILKAKRYKVINSENKEILMDDMNSDIDESLLTCGLFPPEFIYSIGLQWKLRENNIKTILK